MAKVRARESSIANNSQHEDEVQNQMSNPKKYREPFNPKVPPLFQEGGLLNRPTSNSQLGMKVRFMVDMPERHFAATVWRNLFLQARNALAQQCYLEGRSASFAEKGQLEWLEEAGHRSWREDKVRPRCDVNPYIEKLEGLLTRAGIPLPK